jgi:hypothetical protein
VESGRSLLKEWAVIRQSSSSGSISVKLPEQSPADLTPPNGRQVVNIQSDPSHPDNSRGFSTSAVDHQVPRPQGAHPINEGLTGHPQPVPNMPPQPRIASASSSRHPSTDQSQPTPSPAHPFSAHTAHVQDLQHQVSTKTLALQTLQREHDTLLAAFSRHQTSYSTLDKKTKVADLEIKELTEEKLNLQSQVDNLETQVEELLKNKEDAHQQYVVSGTQYMKIMAMSSRLQAQSAADQKRWKAEREEWEAEKESLVNRIQSLEVGDNASQDTNRQQIPTNDRPDGGTDTNSSTDQASGNDLTSMTEEDLRSEIITLRWRCSEMEVAFKDILDEAGNLEGAMQEMASVSQRIRQKARPDFISQPSEPSPELAKEQTE